MAGEVRIDKWLWAMRLFKTRSLAAEACKKGHVIIDGVAVKPSKMIKVGDVIGVKKQPILFSYKVLALTQNRLGAKMVPEYMQQVTSSDQLELLELLLLDKANARAKGLGRPTKKERRSLEEFVDDTPYFLDGSWDDDLDIDEEIEIFYGKDDSLD